MLFDTHCHLTSKRLQKRLGEVLGKAQEVGVTKVLVPGTSVEDSRKVVELVRGRDMLYGAVGVHPEGIGLNTNGSEFSGILGALSELLKEPFVVAVGEVGLDGTVEVPMEVQKEVLRQHIRLAVQFGKSLVLHSRGTAVELMEVLQSEWSPLLVGRTVFHCCEADERLWQFAEKHGIYTGVDGDVTYNVEKQKFVKLVPLEWLVVETDAPYLLPEPLLSEKKYPNEPGYVRLVAECVAGLKGVSVAEVAERTMENGEKLFGLC